jgi:hypothetical protein
MVIPSLQTSANPNSPRPPSEQLSTTPLPPRPKLWRSQPRRRSRRPRRSWRSSGRFRRSFRLPTTRPELWRSRWRTAIPTSIPSKPLCSRSRRSTHVSPAFPAQRWRWRCGRIQTTTDGYGDATRDGAGDGDASADAGWVCADVDAAGARCWWGSRRRGSARRSSSGGRDTSG